MCGIAGIYSKQLTSDALQNLQSMNDALAHRGPDDSGTFINEFVALGHRRLAIIDLSSAGHQPMHSADGKLTIVFNGEIYNYREIRKELNDYIFQTNTDTEVILAAYRKWGNDCINRFNGMFALAIYNHDKNELFIARDRLGIKPLYYTEKNGQFYFASEVRALLKCNAIPRKLNKDVLHEYFTYQTVHAPLTLIKDVFELLPGHTITINKNGKTFNQWWSPAENRQEISALKSYKEICSDVKHLLTKSVERRLISDVPFGAFLSGGIDSSAVVGLMRQVHSGTIKTFTIVFDEEEFSEAKYAKLIAEKFNTEHNELRLSPQDFLTDLPNALSALDHPSGDGPNSYIVSRITREAGITMALSGLGGDEIFAGYPVFNRTLDLAARSWLFNLPHPLKKIAGYLAVKFKEGVTGKKMRQMLLLPDGKLEHTFPLSRQVGLPEYVNALTGKTGMIHDRVQEIIKNECTNGYGLPKLSEVSIAEISTYMQNVLLRDTDQMSMAVALEVRVPFLDYELVEYVLGVPDQYKKPTIPKKLLIDSLNGLLPDEIIYRKKMGFVLPWQLWLKNELRDLCHEKINSLASRAALNGEYLKSSWNNFLEGDPDIRWIDMWLATVLESWIAENNIEA